MHISHMIFNICRYSIYQCNLNCADTVSLAECIMIWRYTIASLVHTYIKDTYLSIPACIGVYMSRGPPRTESRMSKDFKSLRFLNLKSQTF